VRLDLIETIFLGFWLDFQKRLPAYRAMREQARTWRWLTPPTIRPNVQENQAVAVFDLEIAPQG
jgi:hypothetical protein